MTQNVLKIANVLMRNVWTHVLMALSVLPPHVAVPLLTEVNATVLQELKEIHSKLVLLSVVSLTMIVPRMKLATQ